LSGVSQSRHRPVALTRKHHALARRLLERQDDYLRFTWRFAVAPDSNGDERDIRMAKLRQKASGCLRTLAGARRFCARPQLPVHRRQGWPELGRCPGLAHRRPGLDACCCVI